MAQRLREGGRFCNLVPLLAPPWKGGVGGGCYRGTVSRASSPPTPTPSLVQGGEPRPVLIQPCRHICDHPPDTGATAHRRVASSNHDETSERSSPNFRSLRAKSRSQSPTTDSRLRSKRTEWGRQREAHEEPTRTHALKVPPQRHHERNLRAFAPPREQLSSCSFSCVRRALRKFPATTPEKRAKFPANSLPAGNSRRPPRTPFP